MVCHLPVVRYNIIVIIDAKVRNGCPATKQVISSKWMKTYNLTLADGMIKISVLEIM